MSSFDIVVAPKELNEADLLEYGLSLPPEAETSRYPTAKELRSVLDNLEGYLTEFAVGAGFWEAYVTNTSNSRRTDIWIIEFSGDEDKGYPLSFRNGNPELEILILERLTRFCGPLILWPDSGDDPLLVIPGMSSEIAFPS